jgi:DNA-binding winged helix-turn-helix (wHTH) protein
MRLRFGLYTLDSAQRLLLRRNEVIPLSPKAFTLLQALAQRSPSALSKDEIHGILWPDAFVEEGSLHNLVSEIRGALGTPDRKLLRTVPRFGYALTAEARRDESSASKFCLVLGDEVIPLRVGENILGRGDEVDIPVELPGVSRRHARVVANAGSALIEDLGSKNGTFVGRTRVVDPTPLRDGDRIFLGRTLLLFRLNRRRTTTLTEPA